MNLNETIEERFKPAQLMQTGSLLVLALSASLILAFHAHNVTSVALFLSLAAFVLPTAYTLSRRLTDKARVHETEARLVLNTKSYLQKAEPIRPESDIEILARTIDWRRTLPQGFVISAAADPALPEGEPVVYDALPIRHEAGKAICLRLAGLTIVAQGPAPRARRATVQAAKTAKPSIEYDAAVMEEIRIRAAEGYTCLRHGGVEVGGVLFGTRSGGTIRIAAARPLECEYSNGPRFLLSPHDEAALAEILIAARAEESLAGMMPLGFYHSNTRSGDLALSEADRQLFERFFGEAWQVALVVRPSNLAATKAGFFHREGAALYEFELV